MTTTKSRCAECTYDIPEGANYCSGCGIELLRDRILTPTAPVVDATSQVSRESGPVILAGWWRRVGSMVLDELVVFFPILLLLGAVAPKDDTSDSAGGLFLGVFFAGVVLEGVYFTFLTAKGDGRTGGNRAAGIAVRDYETGAMLSVGQSFVRWFVRRSLYVLVVPGLVNDLWPLWDKHNQTFADKAARSIAVRRSRETPELPQPDAVAVEPLQHPGLKGVGVAAIAFVLGVALNVVVVSLLTRSDTLAGDATAVLLGSIALWIPLLGGVVFVSRRRGSRSLATDFGLSINKSDLAIGLLGSFIARGGSVLVALPLYAAFSNAVKSPQIGRPVDELHGAAFAAFALVAVIGAPFVEELFFRGLIQTRLVGRWGVTKGIAVTSILFGAAHLIGWQGPQSLLAAAAISGGGAVLGYLRNRTGRLGTSMVAHGFFNLFVVVVVGIGLVS